MAAEEAELKNREHRVNHENTEHGKDKVTITVDGVKKEIHRGSYIVAQLKAALDVDPSRALDEVIDGNFNPLDDTKRITIKGGEIFVSHVRQGGSS